MDVTSEYRYHRLTWEEMNEAVTAQKGKIIWEAVLSGLIELVDEWRAWPIVQRNDQHKKPVQSQIRW